MLNQEILEAVRYGNKLPYLSDTCQKLRNDLGILQTTRNGLKNNLSILQSEISSLIKTKRVLDTDIQREGSDINNMKNILAKLESLVNLKLTKKEYKNIEKFVEQTVWSTLYEKEELLVIAVDVVLEACLKDPIIEPHMVTSTSQISFRERILQSSKRLYNEAEGICVDRTMSELSNQKVTISNTTCEKQF